MGNVESALAERTPVEALRPTSREIIASALDARGTIHNGRLNDYRGFMEILRCTTSEIAEYSTLPEGTSPTLKLIDYWPGIARVNRARQSSILAGREILETLGRHDIIDQCASSVEEDIDVYRTQPRPQPVAPWPQDDEDDEDMRYIFMDDVIGGSRLIFDGFVVAAPSDHNFVQNLRRRLEGQNIRLIDPKYDVLAGVPEYDVWTYAIKKRCRKLVLVIGEEFTRIEYCNFVVQYATALKPDAKNRKIIVIKTHKDIEMPRCLNFYKTFLIDGDLETLVMAIRAPTFPEPMGRSFSYPAYRNVAHVTPYSRSASSCEQGHDNDVTGDVSGPPCNSDTALQDNDLHHVTDRLNEVVVSDEDCEDRVKSIPSPNTSQARATFDLSFPSLDSSMASSDSYMYLRVPNGVLTGSTATIDPMSTGHSGTQGEGGACGGVAHKHTATSADSLEVSETADENNTRSSRERNLLKRLKKFFKGQHSSK